MDNLGIKEIAAVFAAGGLGATGRVWLQQVIDARWAERLAFVGTLSANLLGCLLIGFFATALTQPLARLAILGGLLGGFTTYSAFALFTVDLAGQEKWSVLGAQLGAHLVGGIVAVLCGAAIARAFGLGEG